MWYVIMNKASIRLHRRLVYTTTRTVSSLAGQHASESVRRLGQVVVASTVEHVHHVHLQHEGDHGVDGEVADEAGEEQFDEHTLAEPTKRWKQLQHSRVPVNITN